MVASSKAGPFKNGHGLDDDNGFAGIDPQYIGLDVPFHAFVSLASAIIAAPPVVPIAAGKLDDTPNQAALYWTYDKATGLHVQAAPGFLSTATGDGGFSLNVTPDGAWALKFDGSSTVIGYDADDNPVSPPPPPPPTGNIELDATSKGPSSINASAGHITVNGNGSASNPVVGYDTIQGGVGDYMIGGNGTGGAGPGGKGNCALYSASPGSVLVDMQNGFGYGGNAEGNVLVNMNQVRGSVFTNIEIGNSHGTDLKSGGNNSLLISTGGNGFELRPDGYGNVLVSTAGADKIEFDPNHGWALGDDNILLGFDAAHGDVIDLSLIGSNFHTAGAAGYNAATGTGDINKYVNFVDQPDGDHLLFSSTGQVQTAGIELLDMKLTHGLFVASLYQSHNILL